MARGGARPGSGRPKGQRNRPKIHQVVVPDSSGILPIEWMLAVLRDPEAEQSRRDMMAREAAPYVHARLSAAMVSSHSNVNSRNDDTNVLQIFAVPRGGKIDPKDGTITVDGDPVTELQSVEPFVGTPALTDKRDHHKQRVEPIVEPLEVIEIDTSNVTVMRRRDDGQDGGPTPAA